jgi:hypothetical protein
VEGERVVRVESEPTAIEGDRLSSLYRWYADDAIRRPLSEWIAVGGDAAWTSVNGESWTRVPTGPTFRGAEPSDVTAWGSRFVVVGGTDDGHNVVWISGPQQP